MAVLDLVLHPDDRLRWKCDPVEEVTPEIQALVDDMIDTMYDAPGIGLAAPQIGSKHRITVIDIQDPKAESNGENAEENEEEESAEEDSPPLAEPKLYVFINPEIVEKSGTITWEEGCLSIPGVFDKVKRANYVKVRALDRDGNPFEVAAEGLFAVCLQHEIDHLNGVLFLDYLSRLKLRMALKKYKKTKQAYLDDIEKKKKEAAKKAGA